MEKNVVKGNEKFINLLERICMEGVFHDVMASTKYKRSAFV